MDLLERLQTALAERYRIERELGRGGMATVYLAEDLKHGRRVALKVLRPELGPALGAERFQREIETASRLQHPHILTLHDSGEAAGLLYYAMPYVEGESLRSRLTREVQLDATAAVGIASDVADALACAHAAGVLHRDIKPENILLTGGHAVVADFGIARALDAVGADRLTETGLALGTPHYMSPEQALESRVLAHRIVAGIDGEKHQSAIVVLHGTVQSDEGCVGVAQAQSDRRNIQRGDVARLRPGLEIVQDPKRLAPSTTGGIHVAEGGEVGGGRAPLPDGRSQLPDRLVRSPELLLRHADPE